MNTLQIELNKLNEKKDQIKNENTVKDDFPAIKRTYKYKKSTIITSNDLNL